MNFGIDLGFGNIKLYGPDGGIVLPSHVATAGNATVADLVGMTSQAAPLQITQLDRSYYVGARAHSWGRPVENLDYDRLTGSPEIRALLAGAFTRYMEAYGRIETAVTLFVGLPLEPLSGDPATVQATVAAARAWLTGVHAWRADGGAGSAHYSLDVREIKITSQPSGALFDYLLDDNGRFIPDRAGHMKQEIGIVSVGFNTVERLAVVNGAPVQRFTAGSTSGVRRLLELINDKGLYSLGELDGLLRTDALDAAQLRGPLDVWSREVNGEIERTWGKQWKRFAHVVIVGGGAMLLNGRLLPRFAGLASMPDDPILAIARGLYKLALLQHAQQGKR